MLIRRIAVGGVRRLLDLALIAVFGASIFAIVLARVVPFTGDPTFVVAGGSMVPTIPLGAAVVTDPVDPRDLAVGDIVSLRSGADHAVFTHRITRVAVQDGGVWIETKGDANPTIDPSLTPASAVIGRVSAVIPLAGFAVAWLALPSGILAVVATGLTLLTVSWLLAGGGRPGAAASPVSVHIPVRVGAWVRGSGSMPVPAPASLIRHVGR